MFHPYLGVLLLNILHLIENFHIGLTKLAGQLVFEHFLCFQIRFFRAVKIFVMIS